MDTLVLNLAITGADSLPDVVPPPVPWEPDDLGSALRGWWVPHSLGLTPGDAVSSLPSSGGITNALTQATAGFRPTYQTFGGKGGIQFDGVDDHMAMGDLSVSNAASALVLWSLHKHITIPTDANYKYLMSVRANTTANKRLTSMLSNTSGTGKKVGATGRSLDGAATINVSSTTDVDTNPHVLITQIIYDGSGAPALDIWRDGTNILSNVPPFTPAPMTASDSGGSHIGADFTVANSGVNCLFGQAGIIRGALSVANRQRLEGYLAWYWGIQANLPNGHPYKSAAPTI